MTRFSERYGYVTPSNTIVRETITIDIYNAISNTINSLPAIDSQLYTALEKYLWLYYFNKLESDFISGYIIHIGGIKIKAIIQTILFESFLKSFATTDNIAYTQIIP